MHYILGGKQGRHLTNMCTREVHCTAPSVMGMDMDDAWSACNGILQKNREEVWGSPASPLPLLYPCLVPRLTHSLTKVLQQHVRMKK